jgi:F-type H+-transporting ATPase subunit b
MVVAANALISVTPGLMIWTIVCFLATFFVLKRYAFGPIQGIIDARREQIRRSLEEADNARAEARRLLEEHRKLTGQARSVADSQRERVREETEADRQRRLEDTRRQIEAETARALDQIRSEVAELTLEATAKVTGKILDDADHRRLIEDAVSGLDFSALEREETRT